MPQISDFIGFQYPIVKTPKGYFPSQVGLNQIKSDLLILLLTYPGERIFLPGFGTPLKDLIFDPNDASLAIRAQQMIAQAISDWEPRISVDQIEVTNGFNDNTTAQDHVLSIKILFRDEDNITVQQDLVLEVPLATG